MGQIIPPKAPNLQRAPEQYSAAIQEELNKQLRLYFNQLDSATRQLLQGFNHQGIFIDTTTQTPAVVNTAYPITLNTTIEHFGIDIDAAHTSRLVVTAGGVYNFQFSLQLDNAGGGVINFWIWFRKNGLDIVNSASHVVLNGPNASTVPSWNYVVTMNAGDYFELVYSCDSLNGQIHYVAAAPPVPAIPSVIITATYLFPNGTT